MPDTFLITDEYIPLGRPEQQSMMEKQGCLSAA